MIFIIFDLWIPPPWRAVNLALSDQKPPMAAPCCRTRLQLLMEK